MSLYFLFLFLYPQIGSKLMQLTGCWLFLPVKNDSGPRDTKLDGTHGIKHDNRLIIHITGFIISR